MFDPGELEVLAGKAAVADPAALGDDELIHLVRRVEAARRALDASLVHALHELDRRGTTELDAGLSTPHWVGWNHQLPRGDCFALVRSGDFLAAHPVLDTALVDGTISSAHVRLLQRLCTPRVADVVQAIQQQLVDLARDVRFETWARQVRALLDLADPDGGHDPRPEDNRLSLTEGLDGTVHLHGDLVGDWALEARAALDAHADGLFHRYRHDADATDGELGVPPRQVLLAMAFVELCRQGRAAHPPGPAPAADVMLVVTTPEDLPDHLRRPGADQDDADWLADLLVTTTDGTPVTRSVAQLLSCDATFRVHVEDHLGEVLSHGRTRRHASPAQRRAAARRFGGCCFPGCSAPPSWSDLHHVHGWESGGRTDQDNLAPLCRRHHGVIHRRGWSMRPAPHGFDITTPTGTVIPSQAHGRPPHQRPPAPA